jgi:hypothetical protein
MQTFRHSELLADVLVAFSLRWLVVCALLQVNGGFEADADVGPMITPEAKARCEQLIQASIDQVRARNLIQDFASLECIVGVNGDLMGGGQQDFLTALLLVWLYQLPCFTGSWWNHFYC